MRALIVGGGVETGGSQSRGIDLARTLVADGHAVRVAVDDRHRAVVEEAGCECWVGTPDRIGTLRYALENVTVLLWLLADVERPELHGSRLEMMLERTIDTTARGVIYEAAGPYGHSGMEIVERMATKNEIPFAVLSADPDDGARWHQEALGGIDQVLSVNRAELPAAWDS